MSCINVHVSHRMHCMTGLIPTPAFVYVIHVLHSEYSE